jgi:hypothetical protein
LSKETFPYKYLFRCVNTHLLTEAPLNGDLDHDKELIYGALRAGRTWVGYDLPSSTSGFRFRARSVNEEVPMGEELVRRGATVFEVQAPHSADIRLVRQGELVSRCRRRTLKHTTAVPGAYRVEVHRHYGLRRRGWIFSSPIYVK